ncbi:MAG: glycosyltransferase [Candidatus Omnitrophota bacterium]
MRTLIVIPCFNEADRLDPRTFLDFAQQHPHIHFLFVNDGSSDNTQLTLEAMARQLPGAISTLELPRNKGKAEAVREGFLRGFTMNAEFIAFFDADLATPIQTILELETAMNLERKDIVMAARVQLLGRAIERNPWRHYAGRLFATTASILLNLPVYDTQCGAKLFRVTQRLKAVFAAPFTVKWIFDVEILARFIITEQTGAPAMRQICLEYPLKEWIDKKGSKIRLVDFLTSGMDLVKIFLMLKKKSLSGA